jgi:hypothetical protein
MMTCSVKLTHPVAAILSRLGVRDVGWPKHPRSAYPTSSPNTIRTLSGAGTLAAVAAAATATVAVNARNSDRGGQEFGSARPHVPNVCIPELVGMAALRHKLQTCDSSIVRSAETAGSIGRTERLLATPSRRLSFSPTIDQIRDRRSRQSCAQSCANPFEFRPHSAASMRIEKRAGASLGAPLLLTGRRPASGPCPSRADATSSLLLARIPALCWTPPPPLVLLDFDGKCEINFAISLPNATSEPTTPTRPQVLGRRERGPWAPTQRRTR